MKFKLISCINQKFFIGKDNNLLYRIKNDLANFKRITLNNVVIMGRKTFESIGSPLNDRINIVVTSNVDYNLPAEFDNVYIVHSFNEVIELCDTLFNDKNCYIIGGESIYKYFLDNDLIDEMFITSVNDDTEGNSLFPINYFDTEKWHLFYQSQTQRQRSEDDLTYKFSIYKRKYE